jgi:hypothetical protein
MCRLLLTSNPQTPICGARRDCASGCKIHYTFTGNLKKARNRGLCLSYPHCIIN